MPKRTVPVATSEIVATLQLVLQEKLETVSSRSAADATERAAKSEEIRVVARAQEWVDAVANSTAPATAKPDLPAAPSNVTQPGRKPKP